MTGPLFASDYASLELKEAEYRCRPIVPRGRLILMVANSTQGKTPFGTQMARDIAAGNNVLDYFESGGPCRVGLVDAESPQVDIAKRLKMQSKRIADCQNLMIWSSESVHKLGVSLNAPGREVLRSIVSDHGIDVLFLDNLFSLSGGVDVTKANFIQPVLHDLRGITQLPHSPSIVLYHHPRKREREAANGRSKLPGILAPDFTRWLEEASGSLVLVNLTDVRLGLERTETHGEEITVFRGRTRIPGDEQDIGPLYLSINEEHALAEIDRRPQVLDEAGPKLSEVIQCLRGTTQFTMKDAILKCAPLDASSRTIRRAVRFAKEHGFICESKPGAWQWCIR